MFEEEVRQHLSEDLIPFWMGLRDETYGGYYGFMDSQLNMDLRADKGAIYHHRVLWFFSNAYGLLQEPELLEAARHAYEFIIDHCMDDDHGGSYWSVSYAGRPVDTTKHTYCQAFLIYALSSYYDVSGDEDALVRGMNLFKLVEDHCCEDYGYLEAFDRQFQPVENDKLSKNGVMADKTMNTLLHVFEAYTELYRVSSSDKVKNRLVQILDIFMNRVYNRTLKRQEVFFDKTMNSILDLHSYGHDIETAWLLDRGCQVIGDNFYTLLVREITRELTETIYSKAYRNKSVLNECENGVDDTHRIWWVQAESIIGFVNGYESRPECSHYYEAAEEIWTYVKEHMMTPVHPCEWYAEIDSKGCIQLEHPLAEPWKAPYHNGRMCIEILKRLGSVTM